MCGQVADISQRRSALDGQRQRLDGMRQKAAIFDVDQNANRAGTEKCETNWGTPDIAVTEDDIDLALLREQQRRKAS